MGVNTLAAGTMLLRLSFLLRSMIRRGGALTIPIFVSILLLNEVCWGDSVFVGLE